MLGFGNRELKRILGPKTEEVPGGWQKLHNCESPKILACPNRNEMDRACGTHAREEKYMTL
jgi:hypothetical protein